MSGYPAFLNVDGWNCVVVGGGAVAARRVPRLLAAGARVTVVSPMLHPDLAALVRGDAVRWIGREYQHGDASGARLVIAATNSPEVNRKAAADSRGSGALVNVADGSARSDFTVPSLVQSGGLSLAISTNGGSPAVTRMVREEIERMLTTEYVALLEAAAEAREELLASGRHVTPEAWRGALDAARSQQVGGVETARQRLRASLGVTDGGDPGCR